MNHSNINEQTPLCSSSNNDTFGSVSHNEPSSHSLNHPSKTSKQSYFDSLTSNIGSLFKSCSPLSSSTNPNRSSSCHQDPYKPSNLKSRSQKVYKSIRKYLKFIGPGILLSSSFCDPGNYITGTAAGALYGYKLLFAVLLSTFFAVFLQILCTKLGCVTGLDLAQNCRKHLPPWLNLSIYVMAEIAIIATDLAEVVGTAISLNILFNIPLSFGVVLTIVDVLVVLMAYRPTGELKFVRYFEYLVSALVMIVVLCFAIELGSISPSNKLDIFRGFLPSKELLETQGAYLFCGILGATVMPHSLYLGSGIVQPRLRDYDEKHGYFISHTGDEQSDEIALLKYRPTIHAINYSLKYSIIELVCSLFTVALFVNSAILIVAGATLADTPEAADADLYSIYNMLSTLLSPLAGTIFALALLFSGQSSGVTCTLAGQMVSEGFLHWSVKPWVRRLITRSLSVVPCLFATLFIGRKGLAIVLTASQVVLSLLLPFVSAPLLYFTAKKSIMSVPTSPPRANPNASGYNGIDINETQSEPNDLDLANDADVLVSAIAAHSIDRDPSQRFPDDASNDTSPANGSLEDGLTSGSNNNSTISPTQTLIDSKPRSRFNPRSEETGNGLNTDGLTSSAGSSIIVPEHEDLSNSTLTNITAFTIFILTAAINLFLILSAAFGADVPL